MFSGEESFEAGSSGGDVPSPSKPNSRKSAESTSQPRAPKRQRVVAKLSCSECVKSHLSCDRKRPFCFNCRFLLFLSHFSFLISHFSFLISFLLYCSFS